MSRRVEFLGDAALLATLETPAEAAALAGAIRAAAWPGVADVVPAYESLGVLFDPDTPLAKLYEARERLRSMPAPTVAATESTLHVVPVDYSAGPDLQSVADYLNISPAEVVRLHASCEYHVMAVGFVPGFAYLGPLPPALRGVPRLASPRPRVVPGGVGLTGDQTGVYPLERPGGWPLIGRTDQVMADLAAGYFRLAVGDRVRFTLFA